LPAVDIACFLLTNVYYTCPQLPVLYRSGVGAVALLLLALLVTPLRQLTGWGWLLNVRRMIGVMAFVYTIIHLIAYVFVRNVDWALMAWEFVNRPTVLLATVAFLGLAMLTATSPDVAISRMGATRWKWMQRCAYVLTAISLLHFLLSRASIGGLPFMMTGCFLWLMGWRVLASWRLSCDPWALAGLAFVCSLTSMLLEAFWPWALWGKYDPVETLGFQLQHGAGCCARMEGAGNWAPANHCTGNLSTRIQRLA